MLLAPLGLVVGRHWLALLAAILTGAAVVAAFARSRDPVDRALALGLGFLLVTPTPCSTSWRSFTPAAVALLRRRSIVRWLGSFGILSVVGQSFAVLFAALMVALPALPLKGNRPSPTMRSGTETGWR